MTKPPTFDEAEKRGLLAAHDKGIHTFSNGTDWECWASGNCYNDCRYLDPDTAGALCAWEAAAMMKMVTPELSALFGIERITIPTSDGIGIPALSDCRFFAPKHDDNGDEIPIPPDPDPNQLVLFADPTEDAALFNPPVLVPEFAGVDE
jgi:hypothetical protein